MFRNGVPTGMVGATTATLQLRNHKGWCVAGGSWYFGTLDLQVATRDFNDRFDRFNDFVFRGVSDLP